MTWMCLDIGERRIGVAFSDPDEMIAQPHSTLRVPASGEFPMDEIRRLVEERGVEGIVVGLPRRLDGSEGTAAAAVRDRAAPLESLGLPLVWWDERLSSVEAERLLLEAGVRRRRRREVTDRVAAAVILQGFLEHRDREEAR